MAGFKNREELLDLLLDKTESVIEDFSKEVVWGDEFTVKQLYKLQDLCEEIRNHRRINPKEDNENLFVRHLKMNLKNILDKEGI